MSFKSKTGVLLVNLGTPDEPSRGAVYRYLKEFLLDPRVIDFSWLKRNLLVRGIIAPFRSGSSAKLYKMLWTEEGSPLKTYGYRLRDRVAEKLGDEFAVELAMRYQSPSIETAVDALMKQKVAKIIVFPLFPQYASASTGSAHEEVMRVLSGKLSIPEVSMINSYYDHEGMIDVFVENSKEYDLKSYDHVLISFHGLPVRQLKKADESNHCLQKENCCSNIGPHNQFCYSAQCHGTAQAIVGKLGLTEDQYTICYQSRLGKEVWQEPYTSDVLEIQAKKGAKRLLVFCPAFVADCLETTVEVKTEYAEEFKELGGETVDLVASLNDHPGWVEAVCEMVLERK